MSVEEHEQQVQAGLAPAPTGPAGRHRRRARRGWLLPVALFVLWLVIGGVAGPFAGKLSQVAQNDSAAFLPASAESTEVAAQQRAFHQQQTLPAVVVAVRDAGTTKADTAYLSQLDRQFRRIDGVTSGPAPARPLPSEDGKALELVVPVARSANPADVVADMRAHLDHPPAGLRVLVTGPAGQIADLGKAFGGIDTTLLLVAGGVVALILVLVYRSPLLPVLVLVSAVLALASASFAVYQLADHDVLDLNGQSQGILSILVFGAATDYALLTVARFREHLAAGQPRFVAMRTAWRGTIEPISASAATVVLAVLCLLFSDLNSNRDLGPVAAIGIAASWLASVSFLPAVLALCGRAAFWPRHLSADAASDPKGGAAPAGARRGVWSVVADLVGSHPRRVWVVTALVLMCGVAFVPQLKADGTAQSDVFLNTVESTVGQQLASRHFPGGTGSPAVVLADQQQIGMVAKAAKVAGVAGCTITRDARGRIVVAGDRAQALCVLTDPAGSEAAVHTVASMRAAVRSIPSAHAQIGGTSAVQLDTQTISERDRRVIIPIVLVVIFCVLALLLRALLAPLLLIGTVVLSFGATLGVSALVFNHLFGFPGADPVVPLFGFVFLVALGIDYNIFLMTRVREESVRAGTRLGVLRGLVRTGGVITSAGVVLAATFAALAVIPILFLAQIAFIVAFGVLLDTVIVRSLLVPALTLDVDRRVWWPSRLSKPPKVGERL